jgi:glycosyltransferase involved in cell wall biosynthesis
MIVQLIAKIDSRIICVLNPTNLGQSASRNMGVGLAKNEYIIFMDDDDSSLASRPTLHLSLFETGNDLTYVSTLKRYSNGYSVRCENSNYSYRGTDGGSVIRYLVLGEKQDFFENLFSPSCALAVRKSSFLKIGGFREVMRRLEDIDFVCRALDSNLKVSWSSEIGVERLDTQGEDKNSAANAKGELILLNNFRHRFSFSERLSFRIMVNLRKKYFAKQRFAIFLSLPQVLVLIALDPRKVMSIVNRLVHDFRKRN